MTTQTLDTLRPEGHDFGRGGGIPLARLVRVELRKMVDTRAGFWLIAVSAAVSVAVLAIFYATADTADRTIESFMGIMATPQMILLPIIGILLVTQEWGQRTGMVTFSLTPHRQRVIGAKVVAALLLGLAALAVSFVLASAATAVGGGDHAWSGFGVDDLGKYAILEASVVLSGLAFGLLFLNSAVAIVVYLVLPQAFTLVSTLWAPLRDARPWLDLASSQPPLYSSGGMSLEQWAHLASGTAVWVLLPLVLGLVRVLRAEVK